MSTTADATGTYRRFAYTFTGFNDYPKGGVWPDGYYMTFNMFNAAGTAFLGAQVCAFDRNQMLTASGTPGPIQCFQLSTTYGGLLPADLDGATPPPAGSPNYMVAFDDVGNNGLNLWKFHVDWANTANSTLTGPTKITDRGLLAGLRRRHLHSAAGHDAAARLAGRPADVPPGLPQLRRPRVAGRESLGDGRIDRLGRALVRGPQPRRRPPSSSRARSRPTRPPAGWARSRWTSRATCCSGYSVSSSSVPPGIRYTGRLVSDAPGTMQAESVAHDRRRVADRRASAAGATTAR